MENKEGTAQGISSITKISNALVKLALEKLASEGLIRTRKGQGRSLYFENISKQHER